MGWGAQVTEEQIARLRQFIGWLRDDGQCQHTDRLEGGGLCAVCGHELADLLELALVVDSIQASTMS
jgi:hypothetical protein